MMSLRIWFAIWALSVSTTWKLPIAGATDTGTVGTVKEEGQEEPLVCFVIRTYWGHGLQYGDGSLLTVLRSLQKQHETRWEALIVVLDNRPFPDLRDLVKARTDERIWVFAEWIKHSYAPKEGNTWNPGYHSKLYNLTDYAVRGCPSSTKWVIMTNGDNEYDPDFLTHVMAAPDDADVVTFDYYSRFQRVTGPQCERFAAGKELPKCKANTFTFCQTDISANAFRRQKLIDHNMYFGLVDKEGGSANDGIMASIMGAIGWKVHPGAPGRCLVDHGPSPQKCVMLGGAWDDSVMDHLDYVGGLCVNMASAQKKAASYPTRFELLNIDVSVDKQSFAFGSRSSLPLPCLRVTDQSAWRQVHTFGRVCAAAVDLPSFPKDIPDHAWDNFTKLDPALARLYLSRAGMGVTKITDSSKGRGLNLSSQTDL